jgi:hypothetical protein
MKRKAQLYFVAKDWELLALEEVIALIHCDPTAASLAA